MTATQNVWNHRTNKSFKHEADLFRAVDDYISYLDYIVENCNGGRHSTDGDDFAALAECWRTSNAARAVEAFDVLNDQLALVAECVETVVDHLNKSWVEYPDNFDELSGAEQEKIDAADDFARTNFYRTLETAFSGARAILNEMRLNLNVSISRHYSSAVASMIESFDHDDKLTNTRIYKGYKIGGEAFYLSITDTNSDAFRDLGDRFGFGDDHRPGLELKLNFDVESFAELYGVVDNDVFGLMFGNNDDYETAERMIDGYIDWKQNKPVDVAAIVAGN